jgi:L-isoleucine 4-hydroxylase
MCTNTLCAPKEQTAQLAAKLADDSYLHLPGRYYLNGVDSAAIHNSISTLQDSYFKLPADACGGGRFRAYTKVTYNDGRWCPVETYGYSQSKEYNETDGGKIRRFAPINPSIIDLDMIQDIISKDAKLAAATGQVSLESATVAGLHQVRYRPTENDPSYSSPPWLHKDDESVVFVHLTNMSHNAIGGDSVIASDIRNYERVLRLDHPLDTSCW